MACAPCFTTTERLQPRRNQFSLSDCKCMEECTNKVEEYTEMHYEPIATTVTCKESKSPQKSLWQRLFGGLSGQKGQDCGKGNKKEKCIPVAYENKMSKPHPMVKRQLFKPECQCRPKPYVCPRSGCYATPKSVCGCHFYFNIENRLRKNCGNPQVTGGRTVANQLGLQRDTWDADRAKEYTYDIHEEPVHDNAAENIKCSSIGEINPGLVGGKLSNRTRYSSLNKGRKKMSDEEKIIENSRYSSVINIKSPVKYSYTARNSSLPVKESIQSDVERQQTCVLKSTTDCDQTNAIRIGLTFTKEGTTYYKQNNGFSKSLKKCEGSESDTNDHLVSDFHNSKGKLSTSISDDQVEPDHQTKISVVEEYLTINGPHSESFRREIMPLVKKRRVTTGPNRGSEQYNQKDEELLNNYKTTTSHDKNTSFKIPLTCAVTTKQRRCSSTDIDRRVSEILRKLDNIEEKMICLSCSEKNSTNNKESLSSKISCTTCNLRCSDNKKEKYYNSDICKQEIRTSNAIIEISQTKSTTQSPPTACTNSETQALNRSLSLDFCTKNIISRANIIVKVPNSDNSKQKCITFPVQGSCSNLLPARQCMPTNKYRQTEMNEDCPRVTWCQVSNALKTLPLSCYCYDCVCNNNAKSP